MSAQRSAIVTGGSSGIGAATAIELGRLGFQVAVGARRIERLQEVAQQIDAAGGLGFAHFLDVSQPDSIDAFYSAAEAALGDIDVVINNAGMSILNLLQNAAVEDLSYEIAVNLTGPMLIARRALPGMLARRSGDLVFISSENAIHPRPYQVAYTAAKAGVEGLVGALERELEGSGVRATTVRVGPTGTEFGAHYDHDILREVLESWKYWGVQRQLHWMPAESVARAIAKVVMTPVEEAHIPLVQVMPGPRKKEPS
jgi:NADP-dependent 3-hydroxy acid dehydrogenase YdfG